MFIYSAYNLCIHSQIIFPGLVSSEKVPELDEQPPDITILIRKISESEAQLADTKERILGFIQDQIKICRFLVEFGRTIIVEPASGIEDGVLRPHILGAIFAILLRQRGLLVLHASSVIINGGAVAFLGHSGWGKSTLANAFYQQGHSLITDDIMAVQVEDDPPITFSGYPYVRLLSDSATFLGYEFQSLTLIHSEIPKRNNHLTQGFVQTPIPIKRIYILENIGRSHNAIEVISPQDALVALIRHSRAVNSLTTRHFVTTHLHQCTELLRKVPAYCLKRQASLAALADVVKLVKEDLLKDSDSTYNLQTHVLG